MSESSVAKSECEILVVEDSPTQAMRLQLLLQSRQHVVVVARNGREAMSELENCRPSLIISDIVMPEMDGYQLCHALKQNEGFRDIPVVLLTSLSDPEDIIRGLKSGADYYLTKPYDEEYLLSSVESLLKNPSIEEPEADELEVTIAGKNYTVTAGRRQMLNLLLSTYNGAVQRNRELLDAQMQLQAANARLAEQQSKLEEANRRLQQMATHDALTELKNRHAFNEKIDEEVSRVQRYGRALSLVIIDVDHFKSLNDLYGHQIGDETLVVLAQLLQEAARDSDFVARYGGEEFAVILPNTDTEGAIILAERMRIHIEQNAWTYRPITASFGVATCEPLAHITCTSLINAADEALYASKAQGRNRVTHARDLGEDEI